MCIRVGIASERAILTAVGKVFGRPARRNMSGANPDDDFDSEIANDAEAASTTADEQGAEWIGAFGFICMATNYTSRLVTMLRTCCTRRYISRKVILSFMNYIYNCYNNTRPE